jgi:hypothetical protein
MAFEDEGVSDWGEMIGGGFNPPPLIPANGAFAHCWAAPVARPRPCFSILLFWNCQKNIRFLCILQQCHLDIPAERNTDRRFPKRTCKPDLSNLYSQQRRFHNAE